jgi:hypothetical protein
MRGMIWTLAGIALLGIPAAASAAGAQEAAEDPRWLPWIGCWEAQGSGAGEEDQTPLVCVSYLEEADGVEIATWVDGAVLAREELRTDGARVVVAEGGCEGEQWAEWSEDGRRLFLLSEMSCGEGMTRATRGVLAIQDSGRQWLEIHAVTAAEGEPLLGVTTFRPASQEAVARAGVRPADEGRRLAVSTARSLAARAMEPDDVAEAVREVGPEVTRALVVEAGEPFALDAATLRRLKDDGVPEEVLDVMVAVTWPERFAIDGGTRDAEYLAEQQRATGPRSRTIHLGYGGGYYSPYGFGYRSSFGYGYSPYGYGGWGYPGGYWRTPVVIVQPPTVQERGRVTRERGYTAPGATGRPATRRGTQAAPSSSSEPARTAAPRPSGSTRSQPSVSPPPSRPAPAPAPPRKARPRDP